MNISEHIKHFLLTLLLSIPILGMTQGISLSEIYQGESSEEFISSLVLPPSITKAPTNGTAIWQETGTAQGIVGFNTLIYTPNLNFIGKDTVGVTFWRPPATSTKRTLIINVLRSQVFAADDYAYTNADQPITINILGNDSQTNGTLSIREILIANNAENVTIDVGGNITFYPATGFKGIANLSYLVCNEIGVCDVATVSVTVQPNVAPVNDTFNIFTTRYASQSILLPLDRFILDQEPTKGWVDDSEDVVKYVPNGTETGSDVLVYKSLVDNTSKLVQITILDEEKPNLYAKNDYLFTPVNQAIEFDLLANDANQAIEAITLLQRPRFGTATLLEGGLVNYVPRRNFTTVNEFSVDKFTYEVTYINGITEVATAYVYVNNFNPASSRYELTVAKNSPLVMQYAVPVDYQGFRVVSQGRLGKVSFHTNINEEVLGQPIVGDKVLLYVPEANAIGIDEFEVQYCVSATSCRTVKISVEILDVVLPDDEKCISNNCVWEGDVNNDGVVNIQDLLALGNYIGEVGTARNSSTDVWLGKLGAEWNAGQGLKHADTNGDGVVSSKDTSAIVANFSKTHKITPVGIPPTSPLPIYYGKPDTIPLVGPGAILEIPIILGNDFFPAKDIYGLSFEINYSPSLFLEGSVKVTFEDNSWFNYGSPTLSVTRENITGKVDIGITRTNRKTVSGHGVVARFSGIVVADIDLIRLRDEVITPLSITATSTNGQGQQMQLGTDSYAIRLGLNNEEDTTPEVVAHNELNVFPNPVREVLNINLNNLDRFEVFTLTGQKIYEGIARPQLQVSNWNNGFYFLRAYTTDGKVMNQKFEIINR
jgi:hypothetical protein